MDTTDISTDPGLPTNAAADSGTPPSPSLKPVTDAAAQQAARLAGLTRDLLAQGAERCKAAAVQMRGEAAVMKHRTRHYVRDQPLKSLLFAAAAGAVVTGLLAQHGSRNR